MTYSCNDESLLEKGYINSEDNSSVGRITFASTYEMDSVIDRLNEMKFGDQKNWSKNKLSKSVFDMIKVDDKTLYDRSNGLKAILNEDLEFQISDSIMWYNNNNIYFLTSDNFLTKEELNRLKSNVESLKIHTKYSIIDLDSQQPQTKLPALEGNDKLLNTVSKDLLYLDCQLSESDQLKLLNLYNIDIFDGEVFKSLKVSVSVICERRERDYLSLKNWTTYDVFLKISPIVNILLADGYLLSEPIMNPIYRGNLQMDFRITYTATSYYTNGNWSSWDVDETIHPTFDGSDLGVQFFLWRCGGHDHYKYTATKVKIYLANMEGTLYLSPLRGKIPNLSYKGSLN